MAASDQTYRNQRWLHIVFAVTSVAMLGTTVWMFWDDYNRPFKREQRVFREVEEELAKRAILASAPTEEQRKNVLKAEEDVAHARAVLKDVRAKADTDLRRLSADQLKAETNFANVKATFDSTMSFYNIEVEQRNPTSPTARKHTEELGRIRAEMEKLKRDIEVRQAEIDAVNRKPYKTKVTGEEVEITPEDAEDKLARTEDTHKKETEAFDRFVKLAVLKQGGLGYSFRQLPVVDAFASPVRIQQYTLEELPIDYSFKFVTRYDRCTTCHLGMEKPTYDKATLAKLLNDPAHDELLKADLANATAAVAERNKVIADYNKQVASKDRKDPLPLTGSELAPKSVAALTEARINMFAAHPRLDLFVDANSPHPVERFGCSACHGGQGSATDFVNAVHSPNDPLQRRRWQKDNDWRSIHDWDFPMNPQRFKESGCVKCHHQITDLVRDGNRVEAPKLVNGYNLVRELGCFGCHEIAGVNKGRWVGPDLRLEPDPPLEAMTPDERLKRQSDPANPPGTMRRVGPNLSRIAEKTNEEWTKQWIKAPRSFRPDTKMPHYYGQPNNTGEALPKEQEKFPDAEVNAITYYLFATSNDLIKQIGEHGHDSEEARQADAKQADELTAKLATPGLSDKDKHDFGVQLAQVQVRIAARKLAPLAKDDVKLPAAPADDKAKAEQVQHGRHLFSTRGCLACHQHAGTTKEAGEFDGKPVPLIDSDRTFGPELTRLAAKLGTKAGDPQSARAWLVRWLMNPSAHNPRTYMPAPFHADNPQVALQEADDIAAWLLSQPVAPADRTFAPVEEADLGTLKSLARVWLEKSLTRREMKDVLEDGKGFSKTQIDNKPADADERFLEGEVTPEKLKMYIGKKAINNLGCYACHTIAGFETAKPIGTGLNEWGKKDPERIAFEDSEHYVEEHFDPVDVRRDLTEQEKAANEKLPENKRARSWEGKRSYEKFYSEQLAHGHGTRVGFLHLKLQEPRSYDFNRVRGWDERLRMPQFKFARVKRLPGESDADFEKRESREEAEAREAVMTFVLGLVAEPIPGKYVHAPTPDKLALVKGRQVLDKFNCAGCHMVEPGIFEFKTTREKVGEKEVDKDGKKVQEPVIVRDLVLGRLEETFGTSGVDPNEYRFPEHNAWTGAPQKTPGRLRAFGVTRPEGPFVNEDLDKYGPTEKFLLMTLTRAMRFVNMGGETRDIPAGSTMLMPREGLAGLIEQMGGDFAGRLTKYLQVRDPQTYAQQNENKSFAAGPPSLMHEGEKVQPVWLFQFLKNPVPLRPLAVLRMPKFNMSTEDAQSLVNYFAASSKLSNPGIGVTYPYLAVPEREDSYLTAKTSEYDARLKKANVLDARVKDLDPVWAKMTNDRLADAQVRLKRAKDAVEEAKKGGQPTETADKQVAAINAEIKVLQQAADTNDFKALRAEWEQKQAYITDAFKLVANDQLCLQCHQLGSIAAKEQQGPQLAYAADRLRPDWLKFWLTNPQRFLHYKTIMPLNFKKDSKENEAMFIGSEQLWSLDQIKAVRDFLMIFPQVADWPILKDRPATGTSGGK
jgi:mono/diheme cytochrome c family protein